MKIPYKKNHLRRPLIFGVIWLVFSVVSYLFTNTALWLTLGWLGLSIMYFIGYYYTKHYGYLILTEETLKIQGWREKSIRLSDIVTIRQYAGEYVIKTETEEITINPRIITPEYLEVLQKVLRLE